MQPLRPGARLAAAAGLVRPGSRAADIGCDHGRLAAFLVESGRCPFVVAADLRPGPLEKARRLAAARGLEGRVDCRLGDGLSVLRPGEVEDIVVAGMGGETIAAILAAAPWVRRPGCNLVLLPASGQPQLRRWLCENGFALLREVPVTEGRYCYTVLQAAYTGERVSPGPLFCWLGLLRGQRGPAAKAYFAKLLRQLEKELRGRERAGETGLEGLRRLTEEIGKELAECRE